MHFIESLTFLVPLVLACGILVASVTDRVGAPLRVLGVATSVAELVTCIAAGFISASGQFRGTLLLTSLAFLSAFIFFAQLAWLADSVLELAAARVRRVRAERSSNRWWSAAAQTFRMVGTTS